MTKRRFTLGLAFLTTIALGGSALAAEPTIQQKQAEMKTAITGLDISVKGERVAFTNRGRRDVVLFAHQGKKDVVAQLKKAYDTKRTLPNGYKVIGWASIRATHTYTFTLEKDKSESVVAEVGGDDASAQIKLWGVTHKLHAPRKPLYLVPRRYAPATTTGMR
ncbi:MAG: hypothetical protein KC635_27150 [Myxococcales bacterium]|nr:hypothetical protein [Myxococcales bacterium]MCB9736742.1 hypothetical protein [Deltaproteobacteria bacterium]